MKKNKFKILFFFLIVINSISQGKEIIKLEVFGVPFFSQYLINIEKRDLKNMEYFGVKISEKNLIDSLNFNKVINNLELSNMNSSEIHDYRASVIITYKGGRKRKFYISSSGYIIEKNKVYKQDFNFIKNAYFFFPSTYYPNNT